MHARIDRASLAEAATWVAQAIARNPDSVALGGLHIIATAGQVYLAGSDGTTVHRAQVSADVKDDGETLIPARTFVGIVSALSGGIVEVELDAGRAIVSAGRSTYRIGVLDPKDYPNLPAFPTHVGTIDADALADTLATVAHAVSKNPVLIALTAYNLVGDAGHLTVQTTDRYRLARRTAPWADASATAFAANIPAASLGGAIKGLAGPVELGSDGVLFGLRDGNRSIITRALGEEHKFPKTEPIWNRTPLTFVQCETAPLIEALKRSRLVADEHTTIRLEFTDALITVAVDGKGNDGSEEVDAEPGFGDGTMSLRFSADHVADALNAADSELVTFGLIDETKQVQIRPVGDESAALIVMPRGEVK